MTLIFNKILHLGLSCDFSLARWLSVGLLNVCSCDGIAWLKLVWVQRKMLVFWFIPLNLIVLILTLTSMNKSGVSKLYVQVCICFLKCFLKLWVGLCLIGFCFSFIPKVFCRLLVSFAEIPVGGREGRDRPTTDLKQCNSVSFWEAFVDLIWNFAVFIDVLTCRSCRFCHKRLFRCVLTSAEAQLR